MSARSWKSLRGDKRGAVLAEFVIAIVPVMMTFFSFVQLSRVATARLVVKHSAIIGARAAAVMSNANDNTPDQPGGDHKPEITNAVRAAMGPWSDQMSAVTIAINDSSNRDDPYNWIEVKVTATYQCKIPMGFLACGGATKTLEETFRMPHQGAAYKM